MIRVLLIAEIRLYRDGLAQVLAHHPNITVAAAIDARPQALAKAVECSPDVILLDVAIPDVGTITRGLSARAPLAKIVGLGVAECEESVIACVEAGMSGYVPCEASINQLIDVIDNVVHGRLLCPANIVAALARRVSNLSAPSRTLTGEKLTSREREIAAHLNDGMSNKEIAAALEIEVTTVKNHIHRILEKLRAHSRGEAAARLRRFDALLPTTGDRLGGQPTD